MNIKTKAVPPTKTISDKIKILSAKELHETIFPEAKWTIEKFFESGTINMLSSASGNYKSWLTLNMATCIAGGTPLFNEFKTEQQGVWIINEEDISRQIKERMLIVDPEWQKLPIHFSVQSDVKIDEDGVVEEILFKAKKKDVGFIIFDSLRSIHGAEENDATKMQAVLNQLKKISNAGITVLFTHHTRKGNQFGKADPREEVRGSSSIIAGVHSQITCTPKKDSTADYLVITQGKMKGAPAMEPIKVTINLNKPGLPFIYTGPEKQGNLLGKTGKGIIAILESDERWLTIKNLVGAKIGKEDTLRSVLKDLTQKGLIICKKGNEVKDEDLKTITPYPEIRTNENFYQMPNITHTEGELDSSESPKEGINLFGPILPRPELVEEDLEEDME